MCAHAEVVGLSCAGSFYDKSNYVLWSPTTKGKILYDHHTYVLGTH